MGIFHEMNINDDTHDGEKEKTRGFNLKSIPFIKKIIFITSVSFTASVVWV